jgi:predicted short-subunit dehydrogenase-like oxidoreductase (DUF2520 family)
MINVCIIGFGRVGSHLYYALKKTGKFKIQRILKNSGFKYYHSALSKSNLIFICTGDKNISKAVLKLHQSGINLEDKIIFHTSGAKNSEALSALKKEGVITGSFHPVQTFVRAAKKYSGSFNNIFIAVEGNAGAVKTGFKIAQLIKSKPFELSKKQKVFHHICCVISSNYIVTLMNQAEGAYRKSTGKKILKNGFNNINFFDIYKPLVEQTLRNLFKNGSISSLTGPIERNDADTLELHLKSMNRSAPEILPAYIIMGIETVKLALKKKSLSKASALNLIKLLNKY